jgi:hypothetical protein
MEKKLCREAGLRGIVLATADGVMACVGAVRNATQNHKQRAAKIEEENFR